MIKIEVKIDGYYRLPTEHRLHRKKSVTLKLTNSSKDDICLEVVDTAGNTVAIMECNKLELSNAVSAINTPQIIKD